MQHRMEPEFTNLDQSHKVRSFLLPYLEMFPYKERMASSLADLIACSCMLTVTTVVKEAYASYSKGDKTVIPQLKELFNTLGVIQRDSIWWVHTILPKFLRPQPTDYKSWFVCGE